jgi:hypothetical protein
MHKTLSSSCASNEEFLAALLPTATRASTNWQSQLSPIPDSPFSSSFPLSNSQSPYVLHQFFFKLLHSANVVSCRYLAPLHGLDFVTPSLIALATSKVFSHRITITSPERERSMQFGSNIEAVKQVLNGLTPELVIATVLAKVDCPL